MHYTKTTEIITASSITATSCYSGFYLNGRLLELELAKGASQPISTFVTLKFYRETTSAGNFIFKTHCPTSSIAYKPRFKLTSTSTAGTATAMGYTSNIAWIMEPMLFVDERILIKVGESSKTAFRKFKMSCRIDGIAKRELD